MTQVMYVEKPKKCAGGIVFLVLEMITMLLAELFSFISLSYATDVASNMTSSKVMFWIEFLVWFAGYIILIVGANRRNNIGVLIAGFLIFLIIETKSIITSTSNFSSLDSMLDDIPLLSILALFTSIFVWISLIILTCIKKAPKPLCLIPGFVGIVASLLKCGVIATQMSAWEKPADNAGSYAVANNVFAFIAMIFIFLIAIFRPFWVFMMSYWLTHPTGKVAVRAACNPVVPQAYNMQPVQQYQPVYQQVPQPGYQQVPQPGYQQVPQQGYPYGQFQQPPYPQQ